MVDWLMCLSRVTPGESRCRTRPGRKLLEISEHMKQSNFSFLFLNLIYIIIKKT